MNGSEKQGLDEDAFGDNKALAGLKTFDAFRKSIRPPKHHTRLTKPSKDKSLLHNPNPRRRPMDRPNPLHLHLIQLHGTKNMVARHRKLPFHR
jgi:hypothetical protein